MAMEARIAGEPSAAARSSAAVTGDTIGMAKRSANTGGKSIAWCIARATAALRAVRLGWPAAMIPRAGATWGSAAAAMRASKGVAAPASRPARKFLRSPMRARSRLLLVRGLDRPVIDGAAIDAFGAFRRPLGAHVERVRHDARADLQLPPQLRAQCRVHLRQQVERHHRRLREIGLEEVAH